jgi:hypothetical protein
MLVVMPALLLLHCEYVMNFVSFSTYFGNGLEAFGIGVD